MRKFAVLLGALVLGHAAPVDAASRGGTFVYSPRADVIFLDPVHTQQNPDIWIALNLYDTLIRPSADGKKLEPGLASAYELSPDAKTVSLTLRPGTKFADGSPITAGDVKFSLDRARDKTSGEFNFLLKAIDSVEIKGADKIQINLSQPNPAILAALATFNSAIVSEKLLQAAPGANLVEKAKAFAEKPIGSGPFILKSWTRGSEMVLARNPHYWEMGDDGKPLPYVDEVKLVIIPDDATRLLKLKAGEIDGAEAVPFSRVAELKADPKIDMLLVPAAKVIYMRVNNRPTLKDGTQNPMSNKLVRQAMNYAIDKKAIAQVVTYGVGTPQITYMPSSTPLAYLEKGEPYPYNPAKAKQLLQEAGFGGGLTVTVYNVAGDADSATQTQALQQMWGAVGVKLNIQQLDSATRIAKMKAADYQILTSLWTNDINDPGQITSYFTYYPVVESNWAGYKAPEIEELFLKSESEVDVEKRRALYKQIQEKQLELAPQMYLLEVPYTVALNKKVRNFVQIPLGNYIFSGVSIEK